MFTTLLDTCPDGVIISDMDRVIVYCNDKAARLAGASDPRDIVGLCTDVFVPDVSRADIEEQFSRFQTEGKHDPVTLTVRDLRGESLLIEVSSVRIPLHSESPAGVISYFRDVTRERAQEAELARSTELHRLITDHVGDVIWILDLQTQRFSYVSRSVEKLRGYTAEEVLTQPMDEVLTPESQEVVRNQIMHAVRMISAGMTRLPSSTMTRVDQPCKDGSIVPTEVVTTAVIDPATGTIKEVIGITRNITERLHMEKELEETKVFFEAAVEQTPVPIVMVSLPDGILRVINSAAREFFGITDEPMPTGLRFQDISMSWKNYDSEGRECPFEDLPLMQAMQGRRLQNHLMSVQRKDGSRRWELVSATPITNARGDIIAALVVFPDVTEHRRLEEALRTSQTHLEETLATKNAFFDIIAHDLKTPFSNLLGFADILLEENATLNEEERLSYLGHIHTSAHRTYALLENLLDWAQSQTGRLVFDPHPTHILPLVTEVQTLAQDQARMKNVRLDVRVGPELDASVDARMVLTIMRNLVSNAIKYSPEGGTVRIHAVGNKETLELTVQDEGVGMEPDHLGTLFSILGHHVTTGTKGEKGTGLGLLLCKSFVEYHQGTIGVSSRHGWGTTITVRLPRERIPASEPSASRISDFFVRNQGGPGA